MGQLTQNHQFKPYQDLMYKAAIFKRQLEEIGRVSFEMQSEIDQELATSSGRIIEETMNSLKTNHQNEQAFINHQIMIIGTLTSRYQSHINDMNKQSITIYYKEIEDLTNVTTTI